MNNSNAQMQVIKKRIETYIQRHIQAHCPPSVRGARLLRKGEKSAAALALNGRRSRTAMGNDAAQPTTGTGGTAMMPYEGRMTDLLSDGRSAAGPGGCQAILQQRGRAKPVTRTYKTA